MEKYRSPYEAYPFLCDDSEDLRCDFELFTDEMASMTGLLASKIEDKALKEEILKVCELIYHLNPSLRTFMSVTQEEVKWLLEIAGRLKENCGGRCKLFVLTQGCETACIAHVLRVKGKGLVRLLYRHNQQGHEVPPLLFDVANLLSGYFFYLALRLNEIEKVDEISYISRNYK